MKCEEFKRIIDDYVDARRQITRDGLPAEMRSHAHGCLSCTLYLESMSEVDGMLRRARRVEVPPELHDRLLYIGREDRVNPMRTSVKLLFIYVLRFLFPAIIVWTGALFFPPFARVVVEMTLMIFAMTLMIEKLGRRIVTDRV